MHENPGTKFSVDTVSAHEVPILYISYTAGRNGGWKVNQRWLKAQRIKDYLINSNLKLTK